MADTCKIISGIPRGCRDNAGGVYEFYIANYDDVTAVTKTGTPERISAITSTPADAFFKFVPNKNSSNVVENVQASLENGTVGYEQVITMVFGKMEADKRNQIALMGAGTLLIIAKDKNGRFWLYGENDGMVLSGGNTGTGTALADLNGYNLTFTAMEGELAYEVDESIIDALVHVPVVPPVVP